MQRLFVIDNGLHKLSGHHFNQALGLFKGAAEFGYEAVIFSSVQGADHSEVSKISSPCINKFLYRIDPHLNIDSNASSLTSELIKLLPKLDSESDIIFFPNVNYDEIACIPELINKLQKKPKKIVVRILFPPRGHEQTLIAQFQKIQHLQEVSIVTSSVAYSQWLNQFGILNTFIGGPPHQLPYEKLLDFEPEYEFAYLGQAAKVKGFELLIHSLIKGAEIGYKPKTLLHTKGYQLSPELIQLLDHVTLIDGEISEDEFYTHLAKSRCIVTYYDVESYQFSDSGILIEAMALDRLVISSPMPFIEAGFGNLCFQYFCTPGEYSVTALLNKMIFISNQKNIPDFIVDARLKAKLLTSPAVFISKILQL